MFWTYLKKAADRLDEILGLTTTVTTTTSTTTYSNPSSKTSAQKMTNDFS